MAAVRRICATAGKTSVSGFLGTSKIATSTEWRPLTCWIHATRTSSSQFRTSFQGSKLKIPAELQPAVREWNRLVNRFSQRWRYSSLGRLPGGGGYARPDVALWTLIGANVSVFFLWKVFDPVFMTEHFTISMHNVLSGRLHTLVTNFFSHNEFWHLASNLLGLYFFGTEIAYRFGSKRLYMIYFAGGLVSSFGHLAYSYYIYPWLKGLRHSTFVARFVPPALGASGAINALVVLNIMLNPTRVILVDFLFPVPAALFGAYMILKDLWGVSDVASTISHVGHLGGAVVGAVAWVRLRRHW
ncbi:RHOMBOID-like protein 12, mitochondrial [Selaginella moellendorffii]|uniref:RHOMBOID-like protein 12, mitochondrial n=1 Tax=Selaginella moellendorffii TaxID=88036 RepID=UPI000D1C3922|nr:RHOMBOID-like protein 12, mitochondrial [Selaginella moellendorffii]|eukprot:XP_024523104.1 RHOMBOID-like protein 12, mitochondrial [Selaginella moellendorffii]